MLLLHLSLVVVQVRNELPLDEKKRFLKFFTGSDRAPIGGLGTLRCLIQVRIVTHVAPRFAAGARKTGHGSSRASFADCSRRAVCCAVATRNRVLWAPHGSRQLSFKC